MATPIGHSLAGGILFQEFRQHTHRWKILFMILIAANAADLDFIPGIVIGTPGCFHHGPSHSILAAVLFGCLGAIIFRFFVKENLVKMIFLFTGAYLSHLLLDFVTVDTRLEYGIPLFWPISKKYFLSPVLIFSDVQRGGSVSTFLPGLFVRHNFEAILREVLILLPINGIVWLIYHKKRAK